MNLSNEQLLTFILIGIILALPSMFFSRTANDFSIAALFGEIDVGQPSVAVFVNVGVVLHQISRAAKGSHSQGKGMGQGAR